MKTFFSSSVTFLCGFAFVTSAVAQISATLAPLTTFSGDGWLSPADYPYLTTDSTERGFAFSSLTNHLYLVSRFDGTSVRILDATTGAPVLDPLTLEHRTLDVTGVTGGLFPLNMIAVAADGVIYGTNMTTDTSTTGFFKAYKWVDEAAVPEIAFESATLSTRQGDTLDAIGSGADTRLVAGFGNPAVEGSNGYTIINPNGVVDPIDGHIGEFTNISFPAPPPPNAGDFRLGITFTNSNTVIGTAGGSTTATRLTQFSGGTGTFLFSLRLTTASERPMDYALVGGFPLLATIETGSSATADTVRVYDLTDPANPVLLVSADNTTGLTNANINGAGQVKWGTITGDMATLYAMNTNNGIQAFTFQLVPVPEPSAVLLLAGSSLLFAARTRSRRPAQ